MTTKVVIKVTATDTLGFYIRFEIGADSEREANSIVEQFPKAWDWRMYIYTDSVKETN